MRSAGQVFPAEGRTYTDRLSGVPVRQLTDYLGHSHHLYFTNPGWHDGGRRLLFGSDRANRHNLFSVELATGEITQLTDLDPVPAPDETDFMFSCVNPLREEAYFWHRRHLMKLDLATRQMEPLWEMPPKFMGNILNCTADGKYVCTGIFEDLSDRFPIDYMHGYVGFRETWEARPISRILRVATDGSDAATVWEERAWIGHVNTSPTEPHLLTFCHEGPWHLVDNRIWAMDLNSGRAWQVRPRDRDEIVGHEYWHADGVTIGYHGRWPDGEKFFGCIRYDNQDRIEVKFPHETGHIHSNIFSLVVGDGGREVRLWRWNGTEFDGPRALCEHRSSAHIQHVHVHPRFNAAGTQVLFTSDRSGYGNVHLVDVPDFATLPPLD